MLLTPSFIFCVRSELENDIVSLTSPLLGTFFDTMLLAVASHKREKDIRERNTTRKIIFKSLKIIFESIILEINAALRYFVAFKL